LASFCQNMLFLLIHPFVQGPSYFVT